MEARFAAPGKLLKSLVDVLKDVVSEANLQCDATGMSLQAMDSSHVCLVQLSLPASGFAHYRCDEATAVLGLNLKALDKVLKICAPDDIVTFAYDASRPDALSLLYESPTADRISDVSLALLQLDEEALGVPEMEWQATVDMASAEFQRVCKDLAELDDVLVVAVGKDGLKLSVDGTIGKGCVARRNAAAHEADKDDAVVVAHTAPVALKLSLNYLNKFGRAAGLAPRLRLEASNEQPFVVTYPLADTNAGHLRFFLAPKMEE